MSRKHNNVKADVCSVMKFWTKAATVYVVSTRFKHACLHLC